MDSTIKPPRLSVVATHAIQYYVPWYVELSRYLDVEVVYAHRQDAKGQSTAGFGVEFEWDTPLYEGYRFRFLGNVSKSPGLSRFGGCDTPELFRLLKPKRYDAVLVSGWNKKCFVQGVKAAIRNRLPVYCRGDSQLGTRRS